MHQQRMHRILHIQGLQQVSRNEQLYFRTNSIAFEAVLLRIEWGRRIGVAKQDVACRWQTRQNRISWAPKSWETFSEIQTNQQMVEWTLTHYMSWTIWTLITSVPKVIWERAASRRAVANTSSGPWPSFMNVQAACRRRQRLSAHHGQQHFAACIWVLVVESLVFR